MGAFWPSSYQERAFAEDWGGADWELQRHVGPRAPGIYELNGVSCPQSDYCIAVGDAASQIGQGPIGKTVTLAERWRGGRWAREPSPNPKLPSRGDGWSAMLSAISCADRRHCVAIGSYTPVASHTRPLAETYGNDTWTLTPSPISPEGFAYTELDSISCPTPTLCMAVGSSSVGRGPLPAKQTQPLIERWDGLTWKLQRPPLPIGSRGQLNSVSCGSPTSCTVLGETAGIPVTLLAEHWNGRAWTEQTIATPWRITDPGSLAISCAAHQTCTAVGGGSQTSPFIAELRAHHWTMQSPA